MREVTKLKARLAQYACILFLFFKEEEEEEEEAA